MFVLNTNVRIVFALHPQKRRDLSIHPSSSCDSEHLRVLLVLAAVSRRQLAEMDNHHAHTHTEPSQKWFYKEVVRIEPLTLPLSNMTFPPPTTGSLNEIVCRDGKKPGKALQPQNKMLFVCLYV